MKNGASQESNNSSISNLTTSAFRQQEDNTVGLQISSAARFSMPSQRSVRGPDYPLTLGCSTRGLLSELDMLPCIFRR